MIDIFENRNIPGDLALILPVDIELQPATRFCHEIGFVFSFGTADMRIFDMDFEGLCEFLKLFVSLCACLSIFNAVFVHR